MSVLLFHVFWLLFRYGTVLPEHGIGFRYNYLITLGYGVLFIYFRRIYNAYLLGYSRIRMLAYSQFLSQLFSLGIIYFGVSISWTHFDSPLVFLGLLVLLALLDVVWSYFATLLFFTLYHARKTILIYRNNLDKKRFGSIKGKPSERMYKIVEEFQYEGNSFTEIRDRLLGFEAVFVAGVGSRCRNGILKYCIENNIIGFFLPHVGDVIMQGSMHIQSFDSPVLRVGKKIISPEYLIAKRAFDICFSLIGIIVLSPIMLITALAIRKHDGGPVLYKQARLTIGGREFKLLKFRSMRVDAEKESGARLSSGDADDRITPVGRLIRKTRIDELPQLINILKGDMSFVGPRPERPEIMKQYHKKLPDFSLRLQVKAGLTGYAQVYGRYNTSPYEKLEFDLLYINQMRMVTDLQLIFATFRILFLSESTEGVDPSQTTAMIQDIEDNISETTASCDGYKNDAN